MVDYVSELGRSFADVYRKPILLVPFLLQMVCVAIVVGILVAIGAAAVATGISWSVEIVALVAVTIGLFLTLLLNAWFTAGALGMVNDAAEGKTTGKRTFFAVAKTRVWRLLWLQILGALLFLAAALPAGITVLLAIASSAARIAAIILAVLFGLAFLVAAFFLGSLLFFTQPIVIREDATAAAAIAKGFVLLKERTGHVLLSYLLVLGTSLILGVGLTLATTPFGLLVQLHPGSVGYGALNIAAVVIQMLLQLYLGVVLLLFTFRMYLVGYPTRPKKMPRSA